MTATETLRRMTVGQALSSILAVSKYSCRFYFGGKWRGVVDMYEMFTHFGSLETDSSDVKVHFYCGPPGRRDLYIVTLHQALMDVVMNNDIDSGVAENSTFAAFKTSLRVAQ